MGNTGIVDPAKNVCLVNISNSDALRKQLKNVTPKFSGMVRSMGGARISLVLDTATKKTDGTITPGKMLDVTGNKIRSINADGTGLGTVRFLKADTREEVDIEALNLRIAEIVARQNVLRTAIDAIVATL